MINIRTNSAENLKSRSFKERGSTSSPLCLKYCDDNFSSLGPYFLETDQCGSYSDFRSHYKPFVNLGKSSLMDVVRRGRFLMVLTFLG